MPNVTGYIAEWRDHQPPAEFEPLDPWEGNSAQDEVADDVSDDDSIRLKKQMQIPILYSVEAQLSTDHKSGQKSGRRMTVNYWTRNIPYFRFNTLNMEDFFSKRNTRCSSPATAPLPG